MRNPMLYISDIMDSITRIEKYTHGVDYDSFFVNQMMVDAVVRN
jgi:uncharacterized protein with HEPN domain